MSATLAQSLMQQGLSKPSLFEVSIPSSELNNRFGANDYLSLYCRATSLPEITHDVMLINGHQRQGVVSSQPYGIKYNKPLTITVIERSDYHAYGHFHKWLQRTVRTSRGGLNANGLINDGAQKMQYRDSYTCPIILKKLELPTYDNKGRDTAKKLPRDLNGKRTETGQNGASGYRTAFTATFDSAYITSIGDIQFDSSRRDDMVTYDVQFYYDSYEILMGDDTGFK